MANSIQQTLTEQTVRAARELYGAAVPAGQVTVQETRREFQGQLTIVTFPLTRFSRKPPEQTGAEIGEFLQRNVPEITAFHVVKGFLNISLSDAYWVSLLNDVLLADGFGRFPKNGKKIMVEYSSPNTNKPLHLGHVRNILLGHSLAEIMKAYGHDVVRANLVNDRGIHICKSMLAWQRFGNGETPDFSGMKGDHLAGKYYVLFDREHKKETEERKAQGQTEEEAKKNAPLMRQAQDMLRKWEAGDPETVSLWKTMNGWVYAGFDQTYEQMGVDFDKYYYESDTYLLGKDIVREGLEKGVFHQKADGSVWADLTEEGLGEKIVLRADGTSVYITQDIGTAQLKHDEFGMDESVYVVGNEQDYHFKVLFLILKKLGRPWAAGLFHLSYGMVELPSGKMKSREGTVVDADDLMREMLETAKKRTEELGKTDGFSESEKAELYDAIGMGALKYFLLKVDPKKGMLFDPNESVDFQGNTGPFIQYTHARIRSVLRRGGYDPAAARARPSALSDPERDLIRVLANFPAVLAAAAREFSPAHLANYAYEIAKLYNRFYHEESILNAGDGTVRAFRLDLSAASARIIAETMRLMGIKAPERM